jgi:hypothetical protein
MFQIMGDLRGLPELPDGAKKSLDAMSVNDLKRMSILMIGTLAYATKRIDEAQGHPCDSCEDTECKERKEVPKEPPVVDGKFKNIMEGMGLKDDPELGLGKPKE